MENDFKIPLSWYIWLIFWIIPIILSILYYSYDPICATQMLIGSGFLVVLILNKPQWVLPWLGFILVFDLIYYSLMFIEDSGRIEYAVASILMKLSFLGYLLFSKNAKRYQQVKRLPFA